ncbi:MAG: carbamate kinase [Thermoplasmata archaeon]|nr:carbamate kinase [Thermoplasmata archaeon]
MKLVVALGGNAIAGKKKNADVKEQFTLTARSMKSIAEMIKNGAEIVITHGNGPQVGAILLQQKIAKEIIPPMPLHVCVALTQGQIGYMIQQALLNELMERGIKKSIVSIITQVIVDENDEAFKNPTKPIGPLYSEEEAKEMMKSYTMGKYENGYRILVPSPEPKSIVESKIIRKLIEKDTIVIASGGGGIPVVRKGNKLHGIDAVIDKDLASEKLASEVEADILLIITDVDNVFINYGKENQQALEDISVYELEEYYNEGQFPAGSMGPKVKAAIRFIKNGGKRAIITSLDKSWDALNGNAGTQIHG